MTFYYLAFDPFCAEVGYGIYTEDDIIRGEVDIMLPTTSWEQVALVELPAISPDDIVVSVSYSEEVI